MLLKKTYEWKKTHGHSHVMKMFDVSHMIMFKLSVFCMLQKY
jgi:hypothetical protein